MLKLKKGVIGLVVLMLVSAGIMLVLQNKGTIAKETDETENDKQASAKETESRTEEEKHVYVEYDVNELDLYSEEQLEIQTPALIAVEQLRDIFDTKTVSRSAIYPDDYAGFYISSENQLVILLTTNNDMAKYQALFSDEDPVIFRFVQYSYKELLELSAEISDKFAGFVNSVGVDVLANKVSVMVSTADQVDEILAELNVDDSLLLPIEFEVGEIAAAGHDATQD